MHPLRLVEKKTGKIVVRRPDGVEFAVYSGDRKYRSMRNHRVGQWFNVR